MLLLYINIHIQNLLYSNISINEKKKRKTRVVVILIPCSFLFRFRYIIDQREISTLEKSKKKNFIFECKHVLWIERNEIANNIGKKRKKKRRISN